MQYETYDNGYGNTQTAYGQDAEVYPQMAASPAIQKSLFEIFNEFTVLITGEMKQQKEREAGKSDLNIQA